LGLGGVVMAMSGVQDTATLFVLVTLTRGLGQSALSLVSMALVGKGFTRRLSVAMTAYAVFSLLGFMVAERSLGYAALRASAALGSTSIHLIASPFIFSTRRRLAPGGRLLCPNWRWSRWRKRVSWKKRRPAQLPAAGSHQADA
jgi:hypothetical protein